MRNLPTLLFAIGVCFGSFSSPALSSESAFQDIAPDTKIRLISSGQLNDKGEFLAAIELQMPQSTKTYWRVPGETGIPMAIDWSNSQGIDQFSIEWPLPTRDTGTSYVDHVYGGDTIFPIRLNLEDKQSGYLSANIRMGICDEICVPVQVELSLDLEADTPSRANLLRIRQGLAKVPLPIETSRILTAPPKYDTTSQSLTFELAGDLVDPDSLIVSTPDVSVVFGAPVPIGPNQYSAKLLMRNNEAFLEQDSVQFDFNSTEGPYVAISPIVISPTVLQ